MEKIIRFLREAKSELQKVNWPTREQVVQYTIIVVVFSLIVALFLGSLDFLFGQIIKTYFLNV
jgi:preprotein translocase subunit SecE